MDCGWPAIADVKAASRVLTFSGVGFAVFEGSERDMFLVSLQQFQERIRNFV
jgi:hypothetical protein